MAMSQTLEEILESQFEKLRDLETVTLFIKSKGALRDELRQMRTEVSCICNGIKVLRKKLTEMKEQNSRCGALLLLTKALDDKIIHMERNIPDELIREYDNNENTALSINIIPKEESVTESQTIIENNERKQENSMKNCKKMLFQEPEVCPMIALIVEDEYIKIPKYIIGRQSLDTVNNLINIINQILKKKYTFLALGKVHARKQGELNLYMHYKKQELDICTDKDYVHFFTAEDYERQTTSKLNKIKLNLITVLRHCKRLREHRVKNDLRYVIITKQ